MYIPYSEVALVLLVIYYPADQLGYVTIQVWCATKYVPVSIEDSTNLVHTRMVEAGKKAKTHGSGVD